MLEGSEAITVTLATGETYPAEVLGIDPSTDIAALRIHAGRPLPAVELGDSDSIRVGDWAVAIGNPSPPRGRYRRRDQREGRNTIDMSEATPSLQDSSDRRPISSETAAALADTRGRVIAMNTAISPTGRGSGSPSGRISCGGPSQLVASDVARAFLGIYPQG